MRGREKEDEGNGDKRGRGRRRRRKGRRKGRGTKRWSRTGRRRQGEGREEGLRKDKSNGTLVVCDIKLLALSEIFVFILTLGIYKVGGNHVGVKTVKK